jgi:hypothetical protein
LTCNGQSLHNYKATDRRALHARYSRPPSSENERCFFDLLFFTARSVRHVYLKLGEDVEFVLRIGKSARELTRQNQRFARGQFSGSSFIAVACAS